MLNKFVLVGSLMEDIKCSEEGNSEIKLCVGRNFKDDEGTFHKDYIKCILIGKTIARTMQEQCKKDNLIGVIGRIQGTIDNMELVAEKVTFLSSKREE